MGNATSCAPSIASHGATKVVSCSDGTMERYTRPVKAAELMLENPGTFVCAAASLAVGHRIQALSADDELLRRRLYLLLPMELLYSVLTPEELSSFTSSSKILSHNSNSKILSHNSNSRFGKCILPSLGEFCIFLPNNNNSESKKLGSPLSELYCNNDQSHDDDNSHDDQPRLERFYSKQRSWRPALETIVEAPTSSSCRSH